VCPQKYHDSPRQYKSYLKSALKGGSRGRLNPRRRHDNSSGIPKALAEAARVLKPGGEFLLMVVNVDAWMRFASPHAMGHHPAADPNRWRGLLESAGFTIVEQGTQSGALYFLGRKAAT